MVRDKKIILTNLDLCVCTKYMYTCIYNTYIALDIYQYIHLLCALWEGFSFRKHPWAQENHQHVATARYSCSIY